MSTVETSPHTEALIAKLEGAGLTVGDAIGKTSPTGDPLTPPFCVVYPLAGELMGTLDDPEEDGSVEFQVTAVGKTRQQCEWVRDQVRQLLRGGLDVEGRSIPQSRTYPAHVQRDDTIAPPLFFCPERYGFVSTPGGEEGS